MSQLRPHYRGYKSAGNLSDMRSSAELFRSARGKLLIDAKRSLTERRSQIRLPAAKRAERGLQRRAENKRGQKARLHAGLSDCQEGCRIELHSVPASLCVIFCISRFVCGAVLATVVSRQPFYCFRTGSSCFSGRRVFVWDGFFR